MIWNANGISCNNFLIVTAHTNENKEIDTEKKRKENSGDERKIESQK